MLNDHQIKPSVQFPERTAIPNEQSENVMFDIFTEDVPDNDSYCKAFINKLISVPYAQLPEFFTHHCNFISDPEKWLNKTEKLISINEEVFNHSYTRGG